MGENKERLSRTREIEGGLMNENERLAAEMRSIMKSVAPKKEKKPAKKTSKKKEAK